MVDPQLGWSDAQWQMVNNAVAKSFDNASVVGKFITPKGPLSGSAENVREEFVSVTDDGKVTVKNDSTKTLFNLTVKVELSSEQVAEETLTSALLAFQRAASILALAEDFIVFNGYDPDAHEKLKAATSKAKQTLPTLHADGTFGIIANKPDALKGLAASIGADGSRTPRARKTSQINATGSDLEKSLVSQIAQDIASLEGSSHPGPFACVLGQNLFVAAHNPTNSMVMAADRIIPLLGGPLLRSSRLDDNSGFVVSQGDDAIDIIVATPATVQFLQRTENAKYLFRVYERFRLRVKDTDDPPGVISFRFPPP
jgi:uncharacterized linocin/CFP29 family protein